MKKMLLAVVCLCSVGSASMFAAAPKAKVAKDAEILMGIVDGSYKMAWEELQDGLKAAKVAKDAKNNAGGLIAMVSASVPAQTLMAPVKFVVAKITPAINMLTNVVKKGSKGGEEIKKMVDKLSDYIDSMAEFAPLVAMLVPQE